MESSETCWIYSKGFTRWTPQHNTQEQTVVVNSTVSTTQDTACCYVYSNSYTGKGRLCADVYQAGTGTAVCSLVGWLSPPLSLSLSAPLLCVSTCHEGVGWSKLCVAPPRPKCFPQLVLASQILHAVSSQEGMWVNTQTLCCFVFCNIVILDN